jgi:hypothetical protein
MTFLENINSALDRVERRRQGHRGLHLLVMGVSAIGGATATFAAGSTQVAAQCAVCCTLYGGYNCNQCGSISSTSWACTNNCGRTCTCPDCWLPDGSFVGHCDNGCGTCPCGPLP